MILIAFVCALGPLVFFHELGHYLVARWFGVPAETFSIGFGREIVGWTDKQGTRWKVGWLPLGGYVKFVGDMSPASNPASDEATFRAELRDRAFQLRPVWQRFLIVLAGPMANFLLAILIFAAFFAIVGSRGRRTSSATIQPGQRGGGRRHSARRPNRVASRAARRRLSRTSSIVAAPSRPRPCRSSSSGAARRDHNPVTLDVGRRAARPLRPEVQARPARGIRRPRASSRSAVAQAVPEAVD